MSCSPERFTRGQFLGLASAAAGGAALSGCTEIARRASAPVLPQRLGTTADPEGDPTRRVLSRMAYGPRPGEIDHVRAMGLDAHIEEQLSPQRIQESRAAWMRLVPLDTLDMSPSDAEDFETANYPEVGKGQAAVELQQAALLRAVYSKRQLEQVMVEFWEDHFNISQLKAECSWLKTVDDRELRKHALGKFRDLVSASAHSPAMLFYLDNDKNRKRDPKSGSGANENYARELLELHTLGVRGGYSLKDVQEVARCFTGWTFRKGFQRWPFQENFSFDASQHDDGPKRVLGVPIPTGGGVRDGERVIDLVCRHPSTALFVARKLCRRFVADRGPETLVLRLAELFRRTDGDLRQVVSELLHSSEFRHAGYRKLKRPFDFTVSALRILNADTTGEGVLPYLEKMGQLPYKWAMPDGYPDRMEAWTPGLPARWAFVLDLVSGKVANTSIDPAALARATGAQDPGDLVRALGTMVLGHSAPRVPAAKIESLIRKTRDGFEAGTVSQCLALLLASPEFQWR